jgi:hypothetical protein
MAKVVQSNSPNMVRGQIGRIDRLKLCQTAEHASLHPPST